MIKFKWETEFKQTEIGKVPREWEVKNLKEAAEINKTPQGHFGEKANFIRMEDIPTDGVYPSFVAVDVKEIRSGIEVLPNSILLAKITPSFEHGKMCIVPNINEVRWFATTEVFSLVPKGQNSLFFFFYLLKHPILREPLEWSMSGTSGRQRVQLSALKTLPIPLPPPPEQSRIATVLSWFDDLIENKKRQNEILEKVAMAIFKSWLVDFEPFKDEEFVDSELGRVPEGWEVKSVSAFADISLGGTPKREESKYWNGSIKWATAKDVANTKGIYILETAEYISEEGLNHSNAKILPQDSIIITARGTVGEIRLLGEAISFNQTCYGLIPKDNIGAYYLFLSLRHTLHEIKALSYGTVFDTITMKTFDQMKILVPPPPILQKFHSLVEPLFQKIILNQKQIMVLRKIRDALLPKLVFGKLRMEEI